MAVSCTALVMQSPVRWRWSAEPIFGRGLRIWLSLLTPRVTSRRPAAYRALICWRVIAGILWIGVGAVVKSNLQPVGKVQFFSRIGSADFLRDHAAAPAFLAKPRSCVSEW